MKSKPTQEWLRRLLDYDPVTGFFHWRVRRNASVVPGCRAGTKDSDGYVQITVSGVLYLAHRLAWLYVNGIWPTFEIDHRNRIRDDNRWDNLRQADRHTSAQNRLTASANNSTGLLGVSRYRENQFSARITVRGKSLFIGAFSTAELAHAAYLSKKRELHPHWIPI